MAGSARMALRRAEVFFAAGREVEERGRAPRALAARSTLFSSMLSFPAGLQRLRLHPECFMAAFLSLPTAEPEGLAQTRHRPVVLEAQDGLAVVAGAAEAVAMAVDRQQVAPVGVVATG